MFNLGDVLIREFLKGTVEEEEDSEMEEFMGDFAPSVNRCRKRVKHCKFSNFYLVHFCQICTARYSCFDMVGSTTSCKAPNLGLYHHSNSVAHICIGRKERKIKRSCIHVHRKKERNRNKSCTHLGVV